MRETVDFKIMMARLKVKPKIETVIAEDVVVLDGDARLRSFFIQQRRTAGVNFSKKTG